MLEELYTHPIAAPRLRSSPFGPWLDSFDERLAERGYTTATRRERATLAADFGRWVADQRLSAGAVDESVVEAYVADRAVDRERRHAAAVLVLQHLRAEGVAPPAPEFSARCAADAHTQRYAAYMRTERGAAEGTIEGYVGVIRRFLDQRFGTGHVDVATLAASDVTTYLLRRASTLTPKGLAFTASALRSFLRFVFVQGLTATDLSAVPLMSQTRYRASVPRYLSPAEVEQLLGTCDTSTTRGRRNRAILLLLVRLGLRAGEVAALNVDDIRWRSAEIVIRGKGDFVDRLPLLSDVGEAISAYLTKDRPAAIPTRRVFLRLCAPVREIGGRGAIGSVVRRAIAKGGLRSQVRGAHLLRHTLATRMIRAGASMMEIAEVMRHRSPRTTSIYAKVDFEALRALAQPWPAAGGGAR